jgi:hypothetical protein
MKKFQVLLIAALLGLALLVGALLPVATQPVQALSVTPVANLVYSPDRNYFDLFDEVTVATTTHTSIADISAQEWCDFGYAVDQEIDGAGVNTSTVTIEFSNDRTNWIDGPALVSDNVADASDMTRLPIFGRYMRVEVSTTSTSTATPTWTINAFCK